MPRFVVLEHDHPSLHWDFMLETGGRLRTWRLSEPPEPGRRTEAEPLADHRLAYLDYEGPVSGGRGRVMRWDGGHYATVEDSPGHVVVKLEGSRLRGRASLDRIEGDRWVFTS